jgi:hypothetical protein
MARAVDKRSKREATFSALGESQIVTGRGRQAATVTMGSVMEWIRDTVSCPIGRYDCGSAYPVQFT